MASVAPKTRSMRSGLLADRRALVGAVLLGGFLLLALFGPWIAGDAGAIVDVPLSPPSWHHWLGTSGQGQDVLAQTLAGARATLTLGLAVGIMVTLLGVIIGVGGGYLGGLTDDAASVMTNVFLVIPGLPLAIVLAAYLPPGAMRLAVVLTLAGWAWGARVFRAETLALRQKDFVAAAALAGEPRWRIIAVEILPNLASLVASSFVGSTLYAIGASVGLEFLGLGDLGAVTWGTNLYWASNDSALLTGAWWTFVPAGLCVALLGFALTLVSFALDAVTNPRLAHRPGRRAPAPAAPVAAKYPAPTTAGPLVRVRELTVAYASGARVVDQVSFDIGAGEIFGLVGESGSGKSTIGHAMLGLLPEDATIGGELTVAGSDVRALTAPGHAAALRLWRWQEASMVFQSAMSALNPVLTVGAQIVDTIHAHKSVDRSAARKRAEELLAMVGLEPRLVDAWPHQLSGGMRQRVGLALALALEPKLIILDEPTTALDVVVQRQILERLTALQQRLGFAVLFITHDLPLVMELATRVGVLHGGKLVDLAPTSELHAPERHEYTRMLLSSFPSLPATSGANRR
jgi:peptide/nickel transport system permease protein